MNSQTRREIRFGLIALALSGLLLALSTLLRGPVSLTDPVSFIRNAASPIYVLAWTFILVGGVLNQYGSFGLYRYLTYQTPSLIAFVAFVLRIVGIALFLPLAAFFAVNGPVIAKLYQQGNQEVLSVVESCFTGLGLILFGLSGVGEIMGWILFAVALWRDGRLPKSTVFLFLLALPLVVIPLNLATEFLGWVLLLISTSMMAWKGWQESMTSAG
ncbi:MAG TPA: hypothetical protein VFR47_05930 [Anaerolineales bacterium]|nr:hypothetical protein [Anaerolineales bacterium]